MRTRDAACLNRLWTHICARVRPSVLVLAALYAEVQHQCTMRRQNSRECCCVSEVRPLAGLVMWDEVAATKDWVESQLPNILKVRIPHLASSQWRCQMMSSNPRAVKG